MYTLDDELDLYEMQIAYLMQSALDSGNTILFEHLRSERKSVIEEYLYG